MLFKLKPMDVVVVDGLWYMPHHWLIRWRSLDKGVHCVTIQNDSGLGWSPEFNGIQIRPIDHYKGRRITVHRFKGDGTNVLTKTVAEVKESRGYDFRQWFFGGVLGLTTRKWAMASKHYTCSELPYWAFQDEHKITPMDEIIPLPRMFRFHPQFEIVFDGVWE